MARDFDPDEVRAFMRVVMERIGVSTSYQLQNLLINERLMTPAQAKSADRWTAGTNAPSHRTTLILLERAGLLDWDRAPAARAPELTLEAVEAVLDRGVGERLRAVEAELRRLADRLPVER